MPRILCAAIKLTGYRTDIEKLDSVIILGVRHGDCYSTIKLLKSTWMNTTTIEGFIDTDGNFFNRYEAYDIVLKNGQMSATTELWKAEKGETELYSEDLY